MALSTLLSAAEAETAMIKENGGAFIGVRVATMNSDGNLYLVEHPVARLMMDDKNRILGADPAIHTSLLGFSDLKVVPPGDTVTANKKTPFVWAEEHYR